MHTLFYEEAVCKRVLKMEKTYLMDMSNIAM